MTPVGQHLDVVAMLRAGQARYGWSYVQSEYKGHRLSIAVLSDAMMFDHVPSCDWSRKVMSSDDFFHGVRLPAMPKELQQIADLLCGMLMTPRVIDLIWLQAEIKFDAIVNNGKSPPAFKIVADMDVCSSHPDSLHQRIAAAVKAAGGPRDGALVSCVGKYWCLVNELNQGGLLYGDQTACNYGWCSSQASRFGFTPGVKLWQRPGFKHNINQIDPSQTIRVMFRDGLLLRAGSSEEEPIDLRKVAVDPELCGLLTHDARPLSYLRQKSSGEPLKPLGTLVLPPVTIEGSL